MLEHDGTKPITLNDRAEIERLYFRYGHGDSAHAFPSLYLWQDDMGLRLTVKKEAYAVKSRWKGEDAWFFPVGGEAEKAACIQTLLRCGLKRLCYVTEADADFLERFFPGVFAIRPAPEDSEYLYDRRQMMDMPGGQFVKIRNLYRRLEREHSLSAEPVTEASLPLVVDITEKWSPGGNAEGGISDARFMGRLLDTWNALALRGVILRLDGEPWAVAAGYFLSPSTFDCCLMKAKKNIPGVAEHLRTALAGILPGDVTLMNFEEDLGMEGLRLMKMRFRPCGILTMYCGEIR